MLPVISLIHGSWVRAPPAFFSFSDVPVRLLTVAYDLPRRHTALSFLAPGHMIDELKCVAYVDV